MSLDFYLIEDKPTQVFSLNITHNLTLMAKAAGVYYCLWRPEELGLEVAKDLIEPLKLGLRELESNPEHYKSFNPPNGWGSYEGLIETIEEVIAACESNPEARIEVDR